MPDDKVDEKVDTAGDTATETAPAPSYVTREELQSQSDALLSRIQGLLEGATIGQRVEAPRPTAPTVDYAAIDTAIQEGRGASEIARLVDQAVQAKVAAAVAEHVEPLRNVGLSNLEQVARAQALSGKKHAKKFEREIDSLMRNVDPAGRSSVDAWNKAYAMAVGMKSDELEKEAVEAAVRTALAQRVDSSPKPGSSALVDDDGTALPSVDDAFGADWQRALAEKGQTPDDWARRAGYGDMKSYLKLYKQMDSVNSKDLI